MSLDQDDLSKIHIHPKYEVDFVLPKAPKLFTKPSMKAAAVLFMAVGCSHRRSTEFLNDVLRVWKKWRKAPCKTAVELEVLLWDTCRDKALRCPWRPAEVKPLRIITSHVESEESWKERGLATRAEWLRLMQELCDAMNGIRPCEIVIVPAVQPENN